MATWTLGRVPDAGEVYSTPAYQPFKGERVGLTKTNRGLEVCRITGGDDQQSYDVSYTWPGGDEHAAACKAIKHYERRTGREV